MNVTVSPVLVAEGITHLLRDGAATDLVVREGDPELLRQGPWGGRALSPDVPTVW
ncbi:hypothetical protein ACFQ0X_01890 [Streptomyces rectiviolaceus]|uniref:Uncharacterized protein n=1 Tax=Streptomyces rectiviolaceus TaxID=332591 RepID=A0ABP6MTE8_9ACTN